MLRLDVRVLATCVIGTVYFASCRYQAIPQNWRERKRDAGELANLLLFFAARTLQCGVYNAMVSVAPEMGLV